MRRMPFSTRLRLGSICALAAPADVWGSCFSSEAGARAVRSLAFANRVKRQRSDDDVVKAAASADAETVPDPVLPKGTESRRNDVFRAIAP
jgi:hypothetical protein